MSKDRPLSIYIASAGAGKTHTLTREYLKIALRKDFGCIQAVTFTNKATEEMKERIVQELYGIASEPIHLGGKRKSVFFDELCSDLSYTPDKLQQRAQEVLRALLMNYGRFRIKTIDSFFQEVLRSFARELNLSGGFRLQLEADIALEAAVVGVLAEQDDTTEGNKAVQQWIAQLAKELILSGKGHNLKREILKLAEELKHEHVKQLSLSGQFPNQQTLRAFKKHLAEEEKQLSTQLLGYGTKVLQILNEAGISIEDTSYKTSGGLAPLYRLWSTTSPKEALRGELISKRLNAIMQDNDKLFGKNGIGISEKINTLRGLGLWRILEEYCHFVRNEVPRLRSVIQVQSLLNSYGLITEVDKKLKEQQRSAGSLLLADAPSLIHAILSDSSGVQFIYEKLGVRLEHQMIDEFQDTSRLQYQNFLPLLYESLAYGNENLIVGDLKQSIYRFRNSDSNLLASQIQMDFSEQFNKENLDENWRSSKEIIEFNNRLFGSINNTLADTYNSWIDEISKISSTIDVIQAKARASSIKLYYEGHEQNLPDARKNKRGAVAIHEYILSDTLSNESEDTEENQSIDTGRCPSPNSIEDSLPRTIIDLQKRGYRPCDIAILVKRKAEAKHIALALEAYASREEMQGSPYSLEIISSEALQIDAAKSVRCVIAALGYILNPLSNQSKHLLEEAYRQMAKDRSLHLSDDELYHILDIGRRSLYEVIEGLLALWRTVMEPGELPYQIKLLDMALAFQSDLSADISDFLQMWNESGSRQTLTVPDDERKIRLMTIHKSKGLGFEVVLLPYPTWSLVEKSPRNQPILWCDNPLGMQNEVTKIPVKYSDGLVNTLFANEYIEESVKMSLDALNLFYVATTRAKVELHIWIPNQEKSDPKILARYQKAIESSKKEKESSQTQLPKSILELIYNPLHEYKKSNTSQIHWFEVIENDKVEESINLSSSTSDKTTSDALYINSLHVYTAGDRIEVLRLGLDYFDKNNPRIYGSLMHSILSSIKSMEDIPLALLQAEQKGLFSGSDRVAYEKELTKWIAQIEYPWFSSENTVLREIPIIGGNIETSRRPDRIVLYPDGSADVIDYKFGKRNKAYIRQMQTYQELLRQMGYNTVRGYIWYVLLGEVIKL